MIKIGANDLTNYVPYGGIVDGVESVQDGQAYTAANGTEKSRIKGGRNTYTLTLQRIPSLTLASLSSLTSSDAINMEINGETFSGAISTMSASLAFTNGSICLWNASVTVTDNQLTKEED